jgi:hypothetical protein
MAMPTNRTRRRRGQVQPDVIKQLEAGQDLDYSDDAHRILVDAVYLDEYPGLSNESLDRATALLNSWRPLHLAAAQRRGDPN